MCKRLLKMSHYLLGSVDLSHATALAPPLHREERMFLPRLDGDSARVRAVASAYALIVLLLMATAAPVWAQLPPPPATAPAVGTATPADADGDNLMVALIRLPVAAALGAALALRPRRRGTPARSTAVVQTQILLSVVGAVIMLVVGASLARAFGIVGAANLIRYRSKIEDPKDAVVMLCALAVGLASGVGLYRLAVFSTAFLVLALWIIESFEPESVKHFDLSVTKGEQSDDIRKQVEAVLRRHDLQWELRTLGDEKIGYSVEVPEGMKTDSISDAIAKLDPDSHIAIEWGEKKKKAQ